MANKNHHLENRNGTWYFRRRENGKLKYKKLSTSVLKARVLRDQLLAKKIELEVNSALFGAVVTRWKNHQMHRIEKDQLKKSTWRDWKSAMNRHVLPYFGNTPITEISIGSLERFIDTLLVSPKRINNILVPIRSVFKFAKRHEYIEQNIMGYVDNLKLVPPDIFPLSLDEVYQVIAATPEHYKSFVTTLFFTGCRFGELAALRWANIDLDFRRIRIKETYVYGEVGRTKTAKSIRDVEILDPVFDVFKTLKRHNRHVFKDRKGCYMTPDHFREVVWKPTLERVGVEYRPPIQTRHTFATLLLNSDVDVGWIQKM